MKTKTIILSTILITTFLIIILASFASADFWACFNRGQSIDFCNPKIQDRVAPSDNYRICMSIYNETGSCFTPGDPSACNSGPYCVMGGTGNSSFEADSEAPIIIINSPINNQLYNKRSIDFSLSVNEKSDLYYEDLIKGRGKLTRVCSNCFQNERKRSFGDGENSLMIIAKDVMGNYAYENLTFFIDSKKPQIHKVEPQSQFANGEFTITYSEDNIVSIKLNYGNAETGMKIEELTGCFNGKKQTCSTIINLNEYDGQQITYSFTIKDKGNNEVSSKEKKLDVDISFPEITELTYIQSGKYVYFTIAIDESNLENVEYLDSMDSKAKSTTMCSKLKNGICEKKISLKPGEHIINIQVNDRAGNSISETRTIII